MNNDFNINDLLSFDNSQSRTAEIVNLANNLIEKHCPTFHLEFFNSKRLLGKCSWQKKAIMLERQHSLTDSIESVKDTILHEIAHALCPYEGHNKVWKQTCKKIGAIPQRCRVELHRVTLIGEIADVNQQLMEISKKQFRIKSQTVKILSLTQIEIEISYY